VTPPSLDWTDPQAVAAWLARLRESFADLDAVASDMLRPPRERELGPVLHEQYYGEARDRAGYTSPRTPARALAARRSREAT
jgi:hypothetical protein